MLRRLGGLSLVLIYPLGALFIALWIAGQSIDDWRIKASVFALAIFVPGSLLLGYCQKWNRSQMLLRQWAAANGFQLWSFDEPLWTKGPFLWRTSKIQTDYHFTIKDSRGEMRQGWPCCGGLLTGLWSDRTQVVWDTPSADGASSPI